MTQVASPANRYVYFHLRNDNGEIFYVGKGTGTRLFHSKSRNDQWKSTVAGASGFTPIKVIDGLTDDEAYSAEKILIEGIQSSAKVLLCNLAKGGKGGVSQSNDTKEKQRNAKLGRKLSEEHRAKIGAAHKGNTYCLGKKRTKEHCLAISAALKKRVRLQSTFDKMSKARMGFVVSEETKAKISATKKGVPWNTEQRAKMMAARASKG